MKTVNQAIDEKDNDYSLLENNYLKLTGLSLSLDTNSPPPNICFTKKPLSASIVIPAWNASATILSCLTAIEQSSFNKKFQSRLQVVVVDDGSTDKTWEILKKNSFFLNLIVVKQKNSGQAAALNTGISVAEGDIVVSCDADMILSYYTIEHFMARHEIVPNVLLAGFRSDTSIDNPIIETDYIRKNGSPLGTCFANDERIVYSTPGWPSNMCLVSNHYKRLGYARGLWMPNDINYNDPWRLSDLVFGALFSLSREIYLKVGGYDERLYGWGSTDGLLAAKAISVGQYVIPIYAASGLHIEHPFRTKDKQLEYSQNRKKFFEIIQTEKINNYPNWITPAKKRIFESFTKTPTKVFSSSNTKNIIHQKIPSMDQVDNMLAIGKCLEAYNLLINNHNNLKCNNDDYLLKLEKSFIGMKRYEEAVNILKDTSLSSNTLPELTVELAKAETMSGHFTRANKLLKNLSQTHPQTKSLLYWYHTSVEDHIKQGTKYLDQEFYDVAIQCFEAALIVEPNNGWALKYREKCLKYK